jgi:hypothetical protein
MDCLQAMSVRCLRYLEGAAVGWRQSNVALCQHGTSRLSLEMAGTLKIERLSDLVKRQGLKA